MLARSLVSIARPKFQRSRITELGTRVGGPEGADRRCEDHRSHRVAEVSVDATHPYGTRKGKHNIRVFRQITPQMRLSDHQNKISHLRGR